MSEETHEAASRRRMPDSLRPFLLKMQGGKMYLPAAYRVVWFRDECPDWGIETVVLEGGQEAGFATVGARITNPEGRIISTGIKTETQRDFPAGWVEKAETGAIARALALTGFGTQFSPELEEAEAKGRIADSPQFVSGQPEERPVGPAAVRGVWEGAGSCPSCNAPSGKPHATNCKGG